MRMCDYVCMRKCEIAGERARRCACVCVKLQGGSAQRGKCVQFRGTFRGVYAKNKKKKADLSLLPGPIPASGVEGKTLESAQASVLEIHPEPTLKSEVARSRLALKIKCGGDASGEVCRAGV